MMVKSRDMAIMPRLVGCKCSGKQCPPLNIKRRIAWKIMCQNDICPSIVESMTELSAGNTRRKTRMSGLYKIMAGLLLSVCALAHATMEDGLNALKAKDYKTAFDNFYTAAVAGDVDGQFELARLYEQGLGVGKSYEMALRWYKEAAEQNDKYAQYNVGTMYENGEGVEKDEKMAFIYYKAAANNGLAAAATKLGQFYIHGIGTTGDGVEGLKWLNVGVNGGDIYAMNNLGIEYLYGIHTEKDYDKAFNLIRSAAEKGLLKAYDTLGRMYAEGKGTQVDFDSARKWITKCATAGETICQNSIGWLYENGYGVPQDYKKAYESYLITSRTEDYNEGMTKIGLLYKDGKLGKPDPFMAYVYFNIAAQKGSLLASLLRNDEAKKLSGKEILEAQKVASEWKIGSEIKDPRKGQKSEGKLKKKGS